MKAIKLRNLNGEYAKVNKGKREVYYNDKSNSLLIFDPIDKQCDTHSICNGISSDAYDYLIDKLNNHNNLVVHWMQIEQTTSDYTIYYDMDCSELLNKNIFEIKSELNNSVTTERKGRYKYTKVKDGLETIIEFKRNIDKNDKFKGKFIDHINCDKWDNQVENLRMV